MEYAHPDQNLIKTVRPQLERSPVNVKIEPGPIIQEDADKRRARAIHEMLKIQNYEA